MKCEAIERELSARLDGAVDQRLTKSVEDHLSTCDRCRTFEAQARLIRDQSRLEAAAPIPEHLVTAIMERVRVSPKRQALSPRIRFAGWSRYAAAFATGVLISAIVLGGVMARGPSPALATEIPQHIAEASSEVTAYSATFDVTERNFHSQVPSRRFVARIAFGDKERFRAEIKDLTNYPDERWPRNNIAVGVDQSRWAVKGPMSCPREGLPACTTSARDQRAVEGREPFDADAVLPTDIVLPVKTLVGSDRVKVVGRSTVANRDVVLVELAYTDSLPLFSYLQASGSWRPFFPLDRVILSLDDKTWFPLAYRVDASSSQQRVAWASQNGLPKEPPGTQLFSAKVRSFEEKVSSGDLVLPKVDVPAHRSGFIDVPFDALSARSGYEPLLPSNLGGLSRYRSGVYEATSRPNDEVLASFTKGLSWLKIRETRPWKEPALFGNVGMLAEPVELKGSSVGYYEPATSSLGRRLSIHAAGWDVYLESNLPIEDFFDVAASLQLRGEKVPDEWLLRTWPGGLSREQVTLERAVEEASYVLVPGRLPSQYRFAVAHLVEASGAKGVTLYFRRPATELDGVGIKLHQSPNVALPPPIEPDVSAVRVRGTTGRYSPSRNEIEWIEDDVYRSISGGALDLQGLISLAQSLSAPTQEQLR